MAGQPGRSGGHNRKSLDAHWLGGTHRRDRHGPLKQPPEPVYDWEPQSEDLARLGDAGKAFIQEALAKREYNFLAGRLLLDIAFTLDLLRTYPRRRLSALPSLRTSGSLRAGDEMLRRVADDIAFLDEVATLFEEPVRHLAERAALLQQPISLGDDALAWVVTHLHILSNVAIRTALKGHVLAESLGADGDEMQRFEARLGRILEKPSGEQPSEPAAPTAGATATSAATVH